MPLVASILNVTLRNEAFNFIACFIHQMLKLLSKISSQHFKKTSYPSLPSQRPTQFFKSSLISLKKRLSLTFKNIFINLQKDLYSPSKKSLFTFKKSSLTFKKALPTFIKRPSSALKKTFFPFPKRLPNLLKDLIPPSKGPSQNDPSCSRAILHQKIGIRSYQSSKFLLNLKMK